MNRHLGATPGLPEYRHPFNNVEQQQRCGCKPLSGEFDGQLMVQRPTHKAHSAVLNIALGTMQFRRIRAAEAQEVHELLAANGWKDRIGNLQRFTELLEASQVAEVAIIGDRVVGFARGISDGRSNG